ncbi:MAG: aspartyl protease family protein [Candidatus Eremiobacteraeota bacterium]|nr:aspartyl protease family protein [Candidatus Eremiobacteraeota bacterium]
MKYLAAFVVLICWLTGAGRASRAVADDLPGDRLFSAGRFDDAAVSYRASLASNPSDADATRKLGLIELYRNHLDAASELLAKAQHLDAGNAAVSRALAEIARRRAEAAKRVTVDGDQTSVPFVMTDPLPAIRVRLNGTQDATFFIDTGAPDITVEAALAKRLGLKTTSAGMGTFAGGKHAAVEAATVQSVTLGGATAYEVAAKVLPLPQLLPNLHIDGIIGTGFLERFLATLDYPQHRLLLRKRTNDASNVFERSARDANAAIIPCWLVGDHFVFAVARVNAAPPGLFSFDSGLAGGGLMPSQQLVEAAHIELDEKHAVTGMGGGGSVRAIPFVASLVTVGDTSQRDIRGLYSPEGSPFAMFPFTVQGAISHEFLKHYAFTVDFDAMKLVLQAK